MRMRGRGLARLYREQSGAVVMIVAILLVVLLGLLVLTVDLGRMVASRRDFVRASDAAAIAAAQECADANGEAAASGAADQLATANEAGAVRAFDPEYALGMCDVEIFDPADLAGGLPSVRVGYERELDMFFAPIFGIETGTVGAEATAVWGPVMNPSVVPITVDLATLTNCGIDQDAVPPIDCAFTYPPQGVSNPRWGGLDVEEWGDRFAADNGMCAVSAATLADIITGGGYSLPDDATIPNWDCLDSSGLSYSIDIWRALAGRTLAYPVMDLATSEGSKGPAGRTDCDGTDPECRIDTPWITTFVCLYVPPGGVRQQASVITIQTEWRGACVSSGVPQPDVLDLGVHGVRLID